MNADRTISIRKRVHFDAGRVIPTHGKAIDAGVRATNITCTITVDVPVLSEYPSDGLYRDGAITWLREHGFGPDDEIGLLAQALPEGCRWRSTSDDATVYRRARLQEQYDGGVHMTSMLGTKVLSFGGDGFVLSHGDTPVVVRVSDIVPGYEREEDDG